MRMESKHFRLEQENGVTKISHVSGSKMYFANSEFGELLRFLGPLTETVVRSSEGFGHSSDTTRKIDTLRQWATKQPLAERVYRLMIARKPIDWRPVFSEEAPPRKVVLIGTESDPEVDRHMFFVGIGMRIEGEEPGAFSNFESTVFPSHWAPLNSPVEGAAVTLHRRGYHVNED